MKRKATRSLINAHTKSPRISNFTRAVTPAQAEKIEASRLMAVARRQASMSAMPLQRTGPGETGYVDNAVITNPINSTGTVDLIFTCAQGTAVTQRVGKRIFTKSIQWRGVLSADTTTTTSAGTWIIVYDRRPTGALPALTDIIKSASPFAMNNDDNSGRFQIVHRRDFVVLGNTATPTTGQEVLTENGFIKFRRQIDYKSAGTGAIGDIEMGALYLVTVGQTAAGTADAGITIIFRTRFTEV